MTVEALLYDLQDSPACAKARICLQLKGLSYRRVPPALADVLRGDPRVPRLCLGDGVVVDDAAIAPYLDEGTFFVMRLDVDRVEPAAVEKMMNDVMVARVDNPAFPEDVKKRIQEQAKTEIETTKTWLADMTAAGGKVLFTSA